MNNVFEELSRTGFLSQMSNIYTCIPCVVVGNSNIGSQMLDVQPVVNKRFKNDTVEQHPAILSVPVVFPSSSTSAFTFPVNVGDTVLCVFSQRGLDTFKNSSNDSRFVTPTDFRKFDKRDAIAIPGLFPFSESVNSSSNRSLPHSTKDTVIAHNLGTAAEVEMRLKPDGSMYIKSPATVSVECIDTIVTCETITATCETLTCTSDTSTINVSTSTIITCPVTEWTGNMTFTGNIELNGTLTQLGIYTLDGINMNTHVHGGVTPGVSDTSVPSN